VGGEGACLRRSSPLEALRLAATKLLLTWNRRALPQIENMESFARAVGPWGSDRGPFGCLSVLAFGARGSGAGVR